MDVDGMHIVCGISVFLVALILAIPHTHICTLLPITLREVEGEGQK